MFNLVSFIEFLRMGAFLSEPVTEKISTDEEHERLSYGVCSMQGWRFTQEDNHSCFPQLDEKTSLFGVYDGHGGAEVSRYVASLLPDYVLQRDCWKDGDIGKALSEAFLALDAHLGSRKGLRVLKKLAAEDDAALDKDKTKSSADDDGESEDGSEENVKNLFKEAKMPLEMLMAKYGQALAAARNQSAEEEEEDAPSASKVTKGNKPKEDEEKDESNEEEAASTAGNVSKSDKEDENDEGEKDKESGGTAADTPKENGLPEEEKPTKNGSGGRSKLRLRQNRIVYSDNDDDEDSTDEEYDENSSSLLEEEEADDGDESSGEEEDDDDDEEDEEDLERSIAASDEFALNMLQGPGLDSGCTAVVAVLQDGGTLYVANAGDSRCILSRKGVAVDMSVDHKPEDEEESKRIKEAGGEVTSEGRVNGGLNLSRALGDHAYKQGDCGARKQMISALPDVRRIQLQKDEDEFMLLACDGIWNSMTSQDVVDFVRERIYKAESKDEAQPADVKEKRKWTEGIKLSNICGEMFEHCLAPNTSGDGTGCDNMTAILVLFKDSLWKNEVGKNEATEKKKEEEAEKKEEKMDVGEGKLEKTKEGSDDDAAAERKELEEKYGIVLLTPPPSPPPVPAEDGEEEESSMDEEEEEELDEEEDEDEEVGEAEEEELKDEEKVEEGVKTPKNCGKGSKRQLSPKTAESVTPVATKKLKLEQKNTEGKETS